MKTTRATLLFSLTLSSALLAGSALAAGPAGTAADFGSGAVADATVETIQLNRHTKYVNVNDGDTVKFVSNGKSFTWHFDTFQNKTVLDLSAIAPKALALNGVHVYVGTNPLYQG